MTDTKQNRSGCLTAFIIVLIVLNALGALSSFFAGPLLSTLTPEYSISNSYSMISGVLSLLNIVFLIGVWRYKRWGFYGIIAVSIINIILGIFLTSSIITSLISGLILPLILYFLIKPIWNHMK
jgi:hypothetical protein